MPRLPIVYEPVTPPAARVPTPRVRALEALWREVEQMTLWAPRNLLRWLELRRRMRLTLLSPQKVHRAAPVGKVNDCDGCTDSCCVGPRMSVLLRLKDIGRLMDIGRAELMTHDKPRFDRALLRRRPALARHVHSRAWRSFPVLRQNDYGACIALSDEGLCTLYPHWPQSCAQFPYALDVQAAEFFFSQRCQSYFIHPARVPFVQQMAAGAVAGYNERIKDALLLTFKRDALREMGLLEHLAL